jgi:riboflavin biosynthesis pyrimidine reductase
VRRVHPDPAGDLSDADLTAAYAFPGERPWVRGSMVSTLDGAMRGPDGHSGSISTAADRRVFSTLRMTADVVLVGAGTVRDEGYRPSKRPIAIVTSRLDLPTTLPLFAQRTGLTPTTIVLTTQESAAQAPDELRRLADIVECGRTEVDLAAAIAHLNARGLGHIHCEGGPSLLGSLADSGLLDELLLTVTPMLLGSDAAGHVIGVPGGLRPALRMRTTQVLEDDGSVFIRARRS